MFFYDLKIKFWQVVLLDISSICLFVATGSHLVPTQRPWFLPHPWAHIPFVTNRPEITAETVKPTPTVFGTMGNSRVIVAYPHVSHHQHQQNHDVDGKTQNRDQLFLSRLRNRYRQVWWVKMRWVVLCVHNIIVSAFKCSSVLLEHRTIANDGIDNKSAGIYFQNG